MDITYENRTVRLPDFLIPGASRSGTTALYEHLRHHPDVYMPLEKEPMFFSVWGIGKRREYRSGVLMEDWTVPDLDDYLDLFHDAEPGQITGEASVWYLYDYETTINNIRKLYGDRASELKIILMLRNPVYRAWSHYLVKKARLRDPLTFEESIRPETIRERMDMGLTYSYDYIGFGHYAKQVKAWRDAFPKTRIWIHEEFFADMPRSIAEVAEHLEIPMDKSLMITRRVNPSGVYRNRSAGWLSAQLLESSGWKTALKSILPPAVRYRLKMRTLQSMLKPEPMAESTRQRVQAYFLPHIRELETVLGRSLDIWLDPDTPQPLSE